MSESKPAAPLPSEIAGRYQVIQKLGAGACGTVFKAKDTTLGRMVAIKTIRLEGLAASVASLDERLIRFKREATVSAQLKHPNIVTIYDIREHRRPQLHRHGVHRRRGARPHHRRERQGLRRAGGRAHCPGRRRPRLRPQARRRPSRHQARQHHGGGRGASEGRGLRYSPGHRVGRQPDRDREPSRDTVVHEPGAGEGRESPGAKRSLLRRLRPLRAPRWGPGLSWRLDHGADLQGHHRGAGRPAGDRSLDPGRGGAHRQESSLEGDRHTLQDRT